MGNDVLGADALILIEPVRGIAGNLGISGVASGSTGVGAGAATGTAGPDVDKGTLGVLRWYDLNVMRSW